MLALGHGLVPRHRDRSGDAGEGQDRGDGGRPQPPPPPLLVGRDGVDERGLVAGQRPRVALAPERELAVRPARPEELGRAAALRPQPGGLSQLVPEDRPLLVLRPPPREARPGAEERLVDDLDAPGACLAHGPVPLERSQEAGADQLLERVPAAVVGERGQQLARVAHGARALGGHEVSEDLAHGRFPVRADALQRLVGVLRERAGDAADLLVGGPRQEAPLVVAHLPEPGHGEGEERQRRSLALDGGGHVLDEPRVLEGIALLPRRLDERAAKRRARQRGHRDEVLEDRRERLVVVAAHEEVVTHREEHVHADPLGEVAEKAGERASLLGGSEREQLLELVDDDERPVVGAAPPAQHVAERLDAALEEARHGVGVACDLGS